MFAIISTGGKQYSVKKDDKIDIERIPGEVGSKVNFTEVLAAGEGADIQIGNPVLSTVKVEGELVKNYRGEKLIIFKMKRRKGMKKRKGHRQEISRVKITAIEVN